MRISIQFDANNCYTSTNLGTYVTVQNIGQANAGAFTVTLNNSLSLRVAAGLTASNSVTLWFPTQAFSTTATADSGNEIAESNELNNTLAQILPIPTLPPPCKTATPTRTPTVTTTPGPVSPRAHLPLVLAGSDTAASATATPTVTSSPTPTLAASPTDESSGSPPTP
jgi:hypothetical protein